MLKSSLPRHEQLSDWIRGQINEGVYTIDERLPSENVLGKRFGVSRITVRRALHTLESEGLIYRRQGLGSFVRDRHVPQRLVRLTDFVEDMARAGLVASAKVIAQARDVASADVARALEVERDTPLMRLDRLRFGDHQPIAFDKTWLPVFYAQFLEGHDLERETIHQILERDYEVPVLFGRYRIESIGAPPEVAEHLSTLPGAALLLIERTSFTHGRKCVYFQRRYYRGDRVAFELSLERNPNEREPYGKGVPLREFETVFRAEDPAADK